MSSSKKSCDWTPEKCAAKFPRCFERVSGRTEKNNPGNVQELHQLAHNIMPRFFDGVEFDYSHKLDSNKYLTANWLLSHTRPSGFRLGGVWTMINRGDIMQTPFIIADVNPTTMASNVGVLFYPFRCLRLEAVVQRSNNDLPLNSQITAEWRLAATTLTANFYNVSNDAGRSTFSCMRSVTENWALGAELLLEWTDRKKFMADVALATRYSKYMYSVAMTLSRQGLDISYWQRLSDNLQMANMFAWQRKTEKSIATLCYQWDIEDTVVRAMFDSDFSVGFMYCRYLTNLPLGMGFSLLMSLPSSRFVFGMKFNLDPSGLRRDENIMKIDRPI